MDILVEIPRDKWVELRDLYRAVWPAGAAAYCALDLQLANPDIGSATSFRVYSPEGVLSNGMIAISDAFNNYKLLIHPINDISKIEEALKTTAIVDWNREVMVPSASPDVVKCIQRLQDSIKINVKYDKSIAFKLLLDDKEPLYDLRGCPPNSYVAPLNSEHISLIDTTWTYHSGTTHKFFELLMNNGLSYVLYSAENDQPMAWVHVDTEGALTHLFTLEEYRRKGYAEFITKYAANDLRTKGRTVLAYTLQKKEKPQRLFQKLNFTEIGLDVWIFIKKAKECNL